MNKRGQAAMEFLMTYGWAILAAIIAISVLAYFGVFSPGKYAPTGTVLNQPFTAKAAVVSATNGLQLEFSNGLGDTLNVTSVSISDTGTVSCTTNDTAVQVAAGDSVVRSLSCTGLQAGSTLKGEVTIKYITSGTSLEKAGTGTLVEKITA